MYPNIPRRAWAIALALSLTLPLMATLLPADACSASNARITYHIQQADGCDAAPDWQWDVVVDGARTGVPYYLYIVVYDYERFRGIEFSHTFNGAPGEGLDIFAESVCADIAFTGNGWPNAGGLATYAWNDNFCERFATASVLYAYAYSEDLLAVVPRPALNAAAITSCDLASVNVPPRGMGWITFRDGGGSGCFPWTESCNQYDFPCSLSTTDIHFGEVMFGTPESRTFSMQSTSTIVTAFDFSNAFSELTFSPTSGIVPAGDSVEVTVTWTPVAEPLGTYVQLPCGRLVLRGSVPPSCSLSTDAVDFGSLSSGETSLRTFTVFDALGNGTPFDYSNVHPELSFNPASGVVPPFGGQEIQVTWTPTNGDLSTGASSECGDIAFTGTFIGEAVAGAMMALHVKPVTAKYHCETAPTNCDEIQVRGATLNTAYHAYIIPIVPGKNSTLQSCEVALDYDGDYGSGVVVFQETLCADLSFSDNGWPMSSAGTTTYEWSSCITGDDIFASAAALYVYAYSPDTLRVAPNPALPSITVQGCGSAGPTTTIPEQWLGWISFESGGGTGCKPCQQPCESGSGEPPVPVGVTNLLAERNAEGATISWAYDTEGGLITGVLHKEASGNRLAVATATCASGRCEATDPAPSREGETYWVELTDRDGLRTWHGPVELGPLGNVLTLSPPVQNPAPELQFSFTIHQPGQVKVDIYDPQGRHVANLRDAYLETGIYTESWNGRSGKGASVAEGLYFYRVTHDGVVRTGKSVLLR